MLRSGPGSQPFDRSALRSAGARRRSSRPRACTPSSCRGFRDRGAAALGEGNQTRSLDDHRTKTGAEGWLIAERPLGGDGGETKYYFSNLPVQTSLKELAGAVRSRWPIEQFYQDGKQLCGLDDFQGRRWDGLHHHIALVMLSYSFLALTRWQARSPAALPTLPEVHRQVLLALLTDLVQRWAQTQQPGLSRPFAHLLDQAPPWKSRPLTK